MESLGQWKAFARAHLIAFAKEHALFTAELAWLQITASIGEPDNPNIKGPIFRDVLIKPGHVLEVGHQKATNPQAKGRQVILWKSKLCADRHEMETTQHALYMIALSVRTKEIDVMTGLKKAFELGANTYVA